MRKGIWFSVLLVLLLLGGGAPAIQAQTATKGAIRGIIYHDTNADGICLGSDPTLAHVQVDFTPDSGQTMSLLSNSDGTYGLASVSLGTWRVTARPPAGWVTTSQPTLVVYLSPDQNTAGNINFCLAQSTSGGDGSTTLPESGASVPPSLLVQVALGAFLLLAGAGLIVWIKRSSAY